MLFLSRTREKSHDFEALPPVLPSKLIWVVTDPESKIIIKNRTFRQVFILNFFIKICDYKPQLAIAVIRPIMSTDRSLTNT